MDLQQLHYFVTIAHLENMSRAAEELYVAQPSLSRSLARLEAELGAPLFERQGRHLRLNHIGRAFLQYVEQALAQLAEGKNEVADLVNAEQGLVRLAVLYTVGAELLPDLLHTFRQEHPTIRFQLSQHAASTMIDQLENGEIDLCISSPQPERADIGWAPLRTEEIFLVVAPDHRLAGRGSVSLSEVAGEPFIALKHSYGLREMTDHFCYLAGFTPRITFEGDELVLVRGLAAANLGVAFMPALALNKTRETELACLHIQDIPCQRTIGLAWSAKHYATSAVQTFRQFVLAYFAGLEES